MTTNNTKVMFTYLVINGGEWKGGFENELLPMCYSNSATTVTMQLKAVHTTHSADLTHATIII